MGCRLFRSILTGSLTLLALFAWTHANAEGGTKIRFGALPVLQALPIFVAQERGLFEKAGIEVEVVPFSTAAEKEIALTAGSIDGYFGDLVTPMVLRGNGRDVFIVATNYDTRSDRRMFAVLGKPGSPYKSLSDLAGVPVAVSSNSVIEYVTARLLSAAGVPEDKFAVMESKNIGLRMQMLLSGQLEAATLPEPLVTTALAKGAVLLADDSGLAESQTILAFSGPFLKKNGDAVRAFMRALEQARDIMQSQPDAIRAVMVAQIRLPEPLMATYPVPKFPALHVPDRQVVQAVADWLRMRGVIKPALTYEQVVDDRFLP